MFASLPPVTRALILANIAVYLLQQFAGDLMVGLFALWPLGHPYFHLWQLFTYAFLHEGDLLHFDIAHILFNMFAVFMFGSPLERFWGSRRFAVYYLVSLLSAGATQLIVQNATGGGEPVIGASGGVFGLLLAFAWYFPRQPLIFLFFPVPLPAWLFVTIYGAIELTLGVTGAQSDVAHFAHLGGMLGGALAILYWRMRGRFERGSGPGPQRLK
ncbi:MAG TPA: rhomboid family intramembrane serine protease [Steroidobacteraceae bacterium]|nr:rhomboid family intramembrane serine protease [Steroidobacteraceae bacterium]